MEPGKRFDRSRFTRTLYRICERLDQRPTMEIDFKGIYGEPLRGTVQIEHVWAFGSYARGAPTCADLDLLIGTEVVGARPGIWVAARSFFGALRYVRYYEGTPSKNSSGLEIPGTVSVWTGPKCDWRGALERIRVDAREGRAPREIDPIPFSSEQLACDVDRLKEICDQYREGFLAWDFVPLEKPDLPFDPEEEPVKHSRAWLSRHSRVYRVGMKTRYSLAALMPLIEEQELRGTWAALGSGSDTSFRCGETAVIVGRPSLPTHLLDRSHGIRQLAVAPHFSERGPNGVWLIRRGPNHPEVVAHKGPGSHHRAALDPDPDPAS